MMGNEEERIHNLKPNASRTLRAVVLIRGAKARCMSPYKSEDFEDDEREDDRAKL